MYSSASGDGTGVAAADADGAADGDAAAGDADGLAPPLDVQAAMTGASAAAPPTSAILSRSSRRVTRRSTM